MPSTAFLEQQAIEYAKRGDFGADARRVNEELTQAAPENAGAWTRLARCCLEMGLLDEAAQALDAALLRNPQNTIARNLQLEVTKRRSPPAAPGRRPRAVPHRAPEEGARRARATRSPSALLAAGFGRQEFIALTHLPAEAAVDALAPRLEPLLMALNDRPFAERIVEARNRNAQAGNTLFRRNSVHPGGPGHVNAYHYGGRWEPQVNLGFFAGPQWGRDAVRAGIGFNFTHDGADPNREDGQQRVLAYFERFQQLVSSTWRQLLTDWMRTNAGFIQYGGEGPATGLLPADAVAWLVSASSPAEVGWVFCGRWLFADRPDDMRTLADPAGLPRWIEGTFNDLLPLWMSVYRG